jgi:hypothetical protein
VKKQVLNALAIGIFALVVCNSAQAVQCDFHAMTPGNVSTSITADGSDFLYSYTVGAISNCDLDITSFALPYLPSADISSIASPEGWSYQISTVDSFGLGGSAGTLTWTAADGYGIPETVAGTYLSGFSYDSPYAAVLEVPARVGDALGQYDVYGDDPAIPTAPPVPEPSGLILSMLGLLVGAFGLRRSRAVNAA